MCAGLLLLGQGIAPSDHKTEKGKNLYLKKKIKRLFKQ